MSASSIVGEYLGESADYFAIFGAAVASYLTLRFLCSIWSGIKAFLLAKALGLSVNVKKLGAWAVVTGSTDGIGKAYAHELARRGMKLVLISRNPDKLSDVAEEIASKYKVDTKTIAVDFTGGSEIYDKIREELFGLEIGVLVNNVGTSYDFPEFFCEVEGDKRMENMIRCNVDSVTMMTWIVLPDMAERRKGAIINVSSSSGVRPTPLLTAYSASKAYVDVFSRGLDVEYGPKGIRVQSVTPFFVSTKLSKIRRASFFVPSPIAYASAAIGTLGVQNRTFGCMSHAIEGWFVLRAPDWLFNKVVMSGMLSARKRAHMKRQKTN